MKGKKTTRFSNFTILVFCFTAFLTISAQSFENIKKQIKEHTLQNGMKFIVCERHDAPVASFHLYADVGAANESYNITGISHLLEHMAFKGTKTIGTNNYSKEAPLFDKMDEVFAKILKQRDAINPDTALLASLTNQLSSLQKESRQYIVNNELFDLFMNQGDTGINAYTSNDATQYINSLPSNRLEFWMSVTSDRFMNPVFREFYKEKNVVMEERRLSENNPVRKLIEDYMATAFKAHPYHHTVLGHMSALKRITRQDVRDYFAKYYCPSNIVVAIVGDVKASEVFKLAKLYFGRIPSSPKPAGPRLVEPIQWGERRASISTPSQPILLAGYHRPAGNHEDDAALTALANIVGQGRSSWMYGTMVKKERIAIQTGVFNGLPGDKFPNIIAFLAVPSQGHTSEECQTFIDKEIERIKTRLVTPDELKKYKRSTRKGLISGLKSNSGIAASLTDAEIKNGSWKELFNSLDKVEAVTAEDIQRVAKKYLVKTQRTICEITPDK